LMFTQDEQLAERAINIIDLISSGTVR